jgi:hypothetical protein
MKNNRGTVSFRMKFNRNWNEYSIIPRINGNESEAKTYYTDEKDDALDTMDAMRIEFAEKGYNVI